MSTMTTSTVSFPASNRNRIMGPRYFFVRRRRSSAAARRRRHRTRCRRPSASVVVVVRRRPSSSSSVVVVRHCSEIRSNAASWELSKILWPRPMRQHLQIKCKRKKYKKKTTTRDEINFSEGDCAYAAPSMLTSGTRCVGKQMFPPPAPSTSNIEGAFLKIGRLLKLISSRLDGFYFLFCLGLAVIYFDYIDDDC